MPFIHKHVAVMPDVHLGKGATVGSVIATRGAIIPAAVGVDIGCGMMALRTSLTADELPESLATLRSDIEQAVPHGFVTTQGWSIKGAHFQAPESAWNRFAPLADRYKELADKHPKIVGKDNPVMQLGTLGGGNHFIELCLDEENRVWVMLHSGSRGIGNRIGSYFIERAKEDMRRYFINLPDQDLAYFPEGSPLFDDYCDAVEWAQEYAMENRKQMMGAVLRVMRKHLPAFSSDLQAVNCHHNYISRENHFGANVFVTRKGAVRAREGDLGIIPGSMGARSFIVRGKGNAESFHSCSHGAGRVMSRAEARRQINLDEHVKATEHVECRKDAEVIDESPRAYKNIDDVMRSQEDLVSIEHTLRQVLCVKG
jgi:tRNA-splicing ligase RtcB